MADGDMRDFLRMLAGPDPAGQLLEVRSRTQGSRMRQQFGRAENIDGAAELLSDVGQWTDTYVGVALRDYDRVQAAVKLRAELHAAGSTRKVPIGGNDAVIRSHLLFCEVDTPDAAERLIGAEAPPSMLVSSGTEGHMHAYWQLHAPVSVEQLVVGNRKLAGAVGGDPQAVDAARLLRPPGTFNFKHDPPAPTQLWYADHGSRYDYDQLVGHLADPKPQPVRQPPGARRDYVLAADERQLDGMLRTIETEDYVFQLTGREPNADGKIQCPLPDHAGGNERTPSFQVRHDCEWNCYGCGRGGTIYDLAAGVWGMSLRGQEFHRVRERLGEEFGMRIPQRAGARQLTPAVARSNAGPVLAAPGIER